MMWVGLVQSVESFKNKQTEILQSEREFWFQVPSDLNCHIKNPTEVSSLPGTCGFQTHHTPQSPEPWNRCVCVCVCVCVHTIGSISLENPNLFPKTCTPKMQTPQGQNSFLQFLFKFYFTVIRIVDKRSPCLPNVHMNNPLLGTTGLMMYSGSLNSSLLHWNIMPIDE